MHDATMSVASWASLKCRPFTPLVYSKFHTVLYSELSLAGTGALIRPEPQSHNSLRGFFYAMLTRSDLNLSGRSLTILMTTAT